MTDRKTRIKLNKAIKNRWVGARSIKYNIDNIVYSDQSDETYVTAIVDCLPNTNIINRRMFVGYVNHLLNDINKDGCIH